MKNRNRKTPPRKSAKNNEVFFQDEQYCATEYVFRVILQDPLDLIEHYTLVETNIERAWKTAEINLDLGYKILRINRIPTTPK